MFHTTVNLAYELVKKGGKKNIKKAQEIISKDILNIEST